MSSIPTTSTLLQATAAYLEQELLPTLHGYHRFQTRIAVNALRIALREAALGPDSSTAERRRLAPLLGHDGDVAALRHELADGLAANRFALDAPGLVAHLRRTLAEALAINNPRWIGRDAKTE